MHDVASLVHLFLPLLDLTLDPREVRRGRTGGQRKKKTDSDVKTNFCGFGETEDFMHRPGMKGATCTCEEKMQEL